jgi:tetratricopeptide (TPR) repeat protein
MKIRPGVYFKKGIEDLEAKIAKEPPKNHFYLQLGLFWRELKDYDKLIESLEKALELKASTEVYYHLGYAYQQRNMPYKAVEFYEKSIESNPRFCSAYECLGIIRLTEGKYNEALECFNKILDINPRHLYVNYHIARVYEAMAHYDRAEEEYIRCLKVSDFNHKAHHGLASLYTRQGDYSKAIKHYEKAISLNPGEPLYYSDLGDLYKKRGMNKEAAQAYQKAMRYCAQETLKHPYENLYSVMMWRHMSAVQATPSQQISSEVSEQSEELEAVYNTIPLEPLVIELGRDLLTFIDPNFGSELIERLSTVRRHIALDLGFVIPRVRFKDNSLIGKGEYILKVQDVEAAKGEVKANKLLATHKPELLDLLKGERCNDPVYGNPSLWIEKTQRYFAHKSGFMVFDPSTLITIHLAEIIRTHVRHLFGLQETYYLIEALKKSNSVLVNEVYPEKFTLSQIHTILVNLLEEKISIRNMASIFETLVRYTPIEDTDLLTGYVRRDLKQAICRDLTQHSNEIGAFKLSGALEKLILRLNKSTEQVKTDFEGYKELIRPIFEEFRGKEVETKERGMPNFIVVTSPEARFAVKRFVAHKFPHIVVLSYEEIDKNVAFKIMGTIEFPEKESQKFQIQLSPDEDDVIKMLSNSFWEGAVEVKISALENMVKINKDKALIYIMSALKSEHSEVQIAAQNLLGKIWANK